METEAGPRSEFAATLRKLAEPDFRTRWRNAFTETKSDMVDVFIVCMLLWLWCWDLPVDLPGRRIVKLVSPPFLWLGLWHGWAMFAPEPLHVNRRLKALITTQDGSVEEWRPMEPQQSGWFIDLLWFRSFKFQFTALSNASKVLWRPLCHWIVRQASHDGLAVKSVRLIREYQNVLPPGSDPPLTEWKEFVLYEEAIGG